MSAPIVITVPTKYIPINLAPLAIKTESRSASLSDADESTSSMDEFLVRGKKRRLDHLTWEEKLQRKKLKNRVAAQTSRDRKKAKMEEMEQTIQQQTDQISELQLKCASLQAEKDTYYSKCLELESRQEELERRLNDLQQHLQLATAAPANKSETQSTPVASHSVGSASTLLGSAASAQTPQQQGSISMEAQTTLSQDRTTGPKTGEEKDMLEEFDVSKLEELAESLLANVTSELEGADAGSIPVDAQGSSPSGGMPGPVVGTPSERLESSEETDQGSSLNILNTHNYSKSPFHAEKPHSTGQQQSNLGLPASTILGTYDNESNCITIILNDDDEELPLEEEIICEEAGEDFFSHHDQGDFKVKLEPVRELLSPIPSTCSNYSSSDDLKPAASEEDVFKCPLTPSSFVSDGGYESLGSPNHVSTDFNLTASSWDGFWNLDLFPILTDMN